MGSKNDKLKALEKENQELKKTLREIKEQLTELIEEVKNQSKEVHHHYHYNNNPLDPSNPPLKVYCGSGNPYVQEPSTTEPLDTFKGTITLDSVINYDYICSTQNN